MSAAETDANFTDAFQAFNDAEHGGRLGGLWRLPQPSQPDLAAFVPAPGQSVEAFSLLGGQPVGQPAIHLPAALVTEFSTKPLECARRRTDDPALPACLHGPVSYTHLTLP